MGPPTADKDCIARFDSTSGRFLAASPATVDERGNLAVNSLTVADYVLPLSDGLANQRLTTNGDGVVSWETPPGDGDMSGPIASTDTAIPRFSGTSGKLLQDSGVTIDGSNNLNVPGSTTTGGLVVGAGATNYTLPTNRGTNSQILQITDDTTGTTSWVDTVTGPPCCNNMALARFQGMDGKNIQNSSVHLDGLGNITDTGDLVPEVDNTKDLGKPDKKFKALHLGAVTTAGGSLMDSGKLTLSPRGGASPSGKGRWERIGNTVTFSGSLSGPPSPGSLRILVEGAPKGDPAAVTVSGASSPVGRLTDGELLLECNDRPLDLVITGQYLV